MKILFVASEAVPFAKTGGLADVAGALPRALRQLGHDVRIILPCYRTVEEHFTLRKGRKSVEVTIGGEVRKGLLRQSHQDDTPVYFIDNPHYFDREGLYGTGGDDYPDNGERFGFFCRGVLAFLRRLDFRPDILHLNDWQTGLIPVLLRTELKNDPFYSSIATLLTIHNLGYQGLFSPDLLRTLNLDPGLFSLDGMEYYGNISFLKGGLLHADMLTTVSETYCREIQTPEMGFGFDGIMRHRSDRLHGVLNGIDQKSWDPAVDGALASNYESGELRGKAASKRNLQKELGLPVASVPLVGMVTRLDRQKGLDLVEEAWTELMRRDLQFVLLGTGDQNLMDRFAAKAKGYAEKASIRLMFSEALARRIYAGSDIFLMPSRYEPCGLGQMIALRYGTVPVVRRTGGLADTVIDPADDPRNFNGFIFDHPAPAPLMAAVDRAMALYQDRRSWLKAVRRGMASDFSWARSAKQYVDLYRQVLEEQNV